MSGQRLRIFDDPALPTPSIGHLLYQALVADHGGRFLRYEGSLLVAPYTPYLLDEEEGFADGDGGESGVLIRVGHWPWIDFDKVDPAAFFMWEAPEQTTWFFPDSDFQLWPMALPSEILAQIPPEWMRRP